MSDPQRPVPPTPGYHPVPGTPPAHRPAPGVPATPGYHPNQSSAGPSSPRESGSQDGTGTANSSAAKAAAGATNPVPSYTPPTPNASSAQGEPGAESNNAAPEPTKNAASRPNLGNLVSKLSDQVQALVKGEIELAKVKATNMAKRSGVGIALLVVAGVLALYMLGFLFGAAAEALVLAVPMWAAKLIVAGILLVLVAILALVGKASLQKGIADKPDPQEGIKEGIAAVKKGLE